MTTTTEVLDSPCGKCHKPIVIPSNITITGGEIYHAEHAPCDRYRPTARDRRMAVALQVEAVLAGWRAGTRRRRFGRWLLARLHRSRAGTEATR